MNKRGVVLIICYMVITVLTILGAAFLVRSVSERSVAGKYFDSTQAFWLAEAGVTEALLQLKSDFTNLNSMPATTLGSGQYSVDPIVTEGSYLRITAHGFVPSQTAPRAQRTVKVLVQSSGETNLSNPELITYSIDTTGELKITGSASIKPPPHENSTLDFEEVFGMTKDAVKAIAEEAAAEGKGYVYTDPPTNQQPVAGITWVELTASNKYVISSQWNGSGLLIVNGNGQNVALEITGGLTFTGMIWVIGKVKIAGTAQITGALFAESSTGIESDVGGNSELTLDLAAVSNAFGLLGDGSGGSEVQVISWQETQNP